MANDLFSKIVSIGFGLHKDNRTSNQYQQEFQKLNYKINFSKPPAYKLDIKQPLGIKEKYYFKSIDVKCQDIYNELIEAFHPDAMHPELHYTYGVFFNRLEQYLLDINNYITSRSLNKTETTIINYLKANAILLFMELQEKFNKYSSKEIIEIEDIYYHYFNTTHPENAEIIPSEFTNEKHIKATSFPIDNDNLFKPIKGDLDFRNTKKNILPYDKIIAKKERFARAEELLFDAGIIDKDYNFIPNRARKNKTLIAAFYHTIIDKLYFNDKVFEPFRVIDHKEYVRFLNHRYNTNTSKVFNTLTNSPDELSEILFVNLWFKSIPK
ncbi:MULTISPECIES: DUF6617 family protein [Flavobacteriaceae]|uniref:Uncharacterized protein n=2 Tax=Flavobacteriaceae TaxID=49546 RepID=A0A4Y8AVF2_9FLAO|nr:MULTISPECIES: DUF6617 family protein [Flavobacteriaceae]TEW76526.1 hypothetical protein E2488_01360 [Gramella jeungdoensis]GGK53687.1 hypothetical protein GCM10007963_22520 [Lutibacter litoralis]